MIISSVFAFFAFVLLVLPGFAYTLVRAKYKPARKESALQETSRILASSLAANSIVLLITSCWWSPSLRALINGETDDLYQAYVNVTVRMVGVATISCILTYLGGLLYHGIKDGKQSQSELSVFPSMFVMPGDDYASTSFITLTDGTEIWGRIERYDNAPEAHQHFIKVASPFWKGNSSEGWGKVGEESDLVIPSTLLKTVQTQIHPTADVMTAEELKETFPNDS